MREISKTGKRLPLPFLISGVVFFWGSSCILNKFALKEVGPISLAFFRWCFASIFFFLFLRFLHRTGEAIATLKGNLGHYALLGLLGVSLFYTFQNLGLKYSTAVNVSILINVNPLFIAILSALFLKEYLSLKKIIGIMLTLAGIYLVALTESPLPVSSQHLRGDLLTLLSALCWAIYSVGGKKILIRHDSLIVTSMAATFGTIFLFPMALWEGMGMILTISIWTWFTILLLGIFCSALAYLFWYKILEKIEASQAALYLFLIPLYSTLLAILILGESVTLQIFIGALLILGGILIAQ